MFRSPFFNAAAVIPPGSRAQAMAEGRLVEVTPLARQAGFRLPVALTAAVWIERVAWPWEDWTQDARVRLWELLLVAGFEFRRHRPRNRMPFGWYQIPPGGRVPEWIPLVLHLGPGDHAEPVITILQPGEG